MRSMQVLEDAIIDEQDRVLFREAVVSKEAGALRGAYILLWLSCAESLKRRFKEVSRRDAVAKKIVGEIERKEKAHAAIDLYLLDEARKYGFLDDGGHVRLTHVYEMRCVYGHPYQKQPTSEELIGAAGAVIDLVLHQPLLLRHGYLQEQVRLLTEDPTFLDDQEASVAEYAKEVASRADPAVYEWFINKLWEASEKLVADKTQVLFVRRAIWFSTAFIVDAAIDVGAIDMRPFLTHNPVIGSLSLCRGNVFRAMKKQAQDIVVGNLIERGKLDTTCLKQLEQLDLERLLSDRQRQRTIEAFSATKYSVLNTAGIGLEYYAERLIEDMRSHNWYIQNPALEALQSAGPSQTAELDDSMQRKLGNNVLQCAEGKAKSATHMLESMAEGKLGWPPAVVEGVVEECFINDDDKIRFKTCSMKEALLSLAALSAKQRKEIINNLVSRVRVGSPHSIYRFGGSIPEALEIIDEVIIKNSKKLKMLDILRNTIEAIEVEEQRNILSVIS